MSWIFRVAGMEQIYSILVKEKSLEISRHRWKENNKMFLERRVKGIGIIWFKETVSDCKNGYLYLWVY